MDSALVWAACRAAKLEDEQVLAVMKQTLKRVNGELMARLGRHQAQLLRNLATSIRYHKLSTSRHEITSSSPLFPRYFYSLGSLPVLRHGFALEPGSEQDAVAKQQWHTLTRSFIICPEALRLRYGPLGTEPEWEYMGEYVNSMARVFKGIRIEDAANTPAEVLERLITGARRSNPDILIITADLKTAQSVRLGVTRVLRDAADTATLSQLLQSIPPASKGSRTLLSTPLPMLISDSSPFSHTPSQRGRPEDALPLAALIAFAPTIIGSTRGADILLPYQPQPSARETRLYLPWLSPTDPVTSIFPAAEFVEVGVEYRVTEGSVVGVEVRGSWDGWKAGIPLRLVEPGWFAAVLGFPVSCLGREYDFKFVLNASQWTTSPDFPMRYDSKGIANNCLLVTEEAYIRAPIGRMTSLEGMRRYLNGLHQRMAEQGYGEVEMTRAGEVLVVVRTNSVTLESFVLLGSSGQGWAGVREWRLPGKLDRVECVARLTVQSHYGKEEGEWLEGLPCVLNSYRAIQWFGSLSDFTVSMHVPKAFICVLHTSQGGRVLESLRLFHTYSLPPLLSANSPLSLLTLPHLVYLMWRSSPEETALQRHARDVYKVPGLPTMPYAGLGGLALALRSTTASACIADNLLQGNWLIDYHCQRVADWPLPEAFKTYYWKAMDQIKILPRKYIPAHFLKFIQALYSAASVHFRESLFETGSEKLRKESEYEEILLACTPFYGAERGGKTQGLAAGLPFNSFGSSRRRGRDTFIAFQGLYLVTGRYKEGQREILEFATAVQEGVVPNHLSPETGTFEYHTRDTTWWFIRAVRDFVAQCGAEILRQPIEPWFTEKRDLTLADVLQNIMQKHATGVHFYNAVHGVRMQPNWNDLGADIHQDFDSETGLLLATPHSHTNTWHTQLLRDGAPIEVTALLYSSVLFLAQLSAQGLFPATGVQLSDGATLSYMEWANRIRACFEALYWWPVEDITVLIDSLAKRPSGFYKDTVGAADFETEAVLRPSQCLAMAIAPDLFDPDHACTALHAVDQLLWDGAGLRLQSEGQEVALWVTGFYLKARARFLGETRFELLRRMKQLRTRMSESAWLGLPSLVGEENGTEARSVGALVEALDFLLSLDN